MDFTTGRPATLAPSGVVTSPHALASQAGLDVLRAGGSAVDAAIATSATLSVVYPHMTGLGGDAFWLIHEGGSGRVRFLNGGGPAGAAADIAAFQARGLTEIPLRGMLAGGLTVPGAVASWCEAHAHYGRLGLDRVLQAATGYARDGFPVTRRLAGWIAQCADVLRADPAAAALFLRDGPARAGSLLSHPALARTLEAIARDGRAGFYEGAVAASMAADVRARGGFFTEADLASQRACWGEPLVGQYRDLTLYQTPAPTQGFTLIEMLNLVEPFNLARQGFLGADHLHLLVQAKQIAFHDRDRHLGDPRFVDVPMQRLLSKVYADERRQLIDPAHALRWDAVPSYGSLNGDTVYIAVVDRDGNAVSLIHSLYSAFGSGVMAGDTGVLLQNRGAYFTLEAAHPNALAPGKIPVHTLIASMGKRNDKLWSVLGCMGADGQPQIQLQAYVALMDFGCDIQQALEAPRWLSGRFALGEPRDLLHIEDRLPDATVADLEKRGHRLRHLGAWSERAGHAHGILIDPDNGLRHGGADPRSDGAAAGY